jgi:hypothetical protein
VRWLSLFEHHSRLGELVLNLEGMPPYKPTTTFWHVAVAPASGGRFRLKIGTIWPDEYIRFEYLESERSIVQSIGIVFDRLFRGLEADRVESIAFYYYGKTPKPTLKRLAELHDKLPPALRDKIVE